MSNPEIECPDCDNEGHVDGRDLRLMICPVCNGTGYRPMTDDERDELAEREDMERNAE